MTIFQILMLAASAFFAYKVYEHIQGLDDKKESSASPLNSIDSMIADAEKAYERDDFNRAIMLLNNAHSHDEKNTEILNKLAFVQTKDNKIEQAIENYVKSLEINFEDDIVHNAIAQLYVKQNDFDKATWHYEEALKIDDEYAATYYNYAQLLEKMNENSMAKEYYMRAFELDGEMTEAKAALERLNEEEDVKKDR